ncbi:MAG TPA: response regulator [Terrimicrobiaceae bacterium]|nr:response regulator [Terrimicrobiaceae bacterium]
MRILVVDDDPVISKVFTVMLQRADFEVDVAEDGLKGVEMWENGNYDLVLMDVQMPRMNGFEATYTIREKEQARGGRIPIVAVTGYALEKDKEECLAAGMDTYMSKPIDFKKCIEMIHAIIG